MSFNNLKAKARASHMKDNLFAKRLRGSRDVKNIAPASVVKATSNIPNAGLGLFANKDFKKGDIITQYGGTKMSLEEGRKSKSDYLFHIPRTNIVIDGEHDSGLGRYANDPVIYSKVNADIKGRSKTESAEIVATKNIKKGAEIYVSYGQDYWSNVDHYKLLTRRHQTYLYNNGTKQFQDWVDDNFD